MSEIETIEHHQSKRIGPINGQPFFVQLLILLGLFSLMAMGVSYLAQNLFQYLLGSAFLNSMETWMKTHPSQLNPIRLVQIVSTLATFLIPAMVFSRLKTGNSTFFLLGQKAPNLRLLALIPGIILFFLPLIDIIHQYNSNFHFQNPELEAQLRALTKQGESMILSLLNNKSPIVFCLNFLMVAILPALCEEFFFRGALQNLFIEKFKHIHIGIILSAIIFSAIHGDIYGFVPRASLGIIFGYLVVWGGSIWYSVFAHFLFNGMQAIMMYIALMNNKNLDEGTSGSFEPSQTILFTTFFIFLMLSFFTIAKQKNEIVK